MIFIVPDSGMHRLLLDPGVDFSAREAPRPSDLEGRDLLGCRQAIDGSLAYLQVGSHVVEGEYFAGLVFHRVLTRSGGSHQL